MLNTKISAAAANSSYPVSVLAVIVLTEFRCSRQNISISERSNVLSSVWVELRVSD